MSTGRPVSLVNTSKQSNPRWLVTFDYEDIKDQEICEKSFGKILKVGSIQSLRKNRCGKTSKNENASAGSTISSDSDDKNSVSGSKGVKCGNISKTSKREWCRYSFIT